MDFVRPVLLLILTLAACARSSSIARVGPTSEDRADTLMVFDVGGGPEKVLDWGPAPAGSPHEPREHGFDLRHESARLSFDWDRRAVIGRATVTVASTTKGLASLELDAVGLAIASVSDSSGKPLSFRYANDVIAVQLPRPLPLGAVAQVVIRYEAVRPRVGVYWSVERHVVWTQGKATETRYWLPTYDGPEDKATWDFFVTAPPGQRAFAEGELVGEADERGGTEWHWTLRQPAPTYMMSVAVGPFAVREDRSGSLALSYWAVADSARDMDSAFAAAPRAFRLFADRLGAPPQSRHFAVVAVPNFIFWDGLEMWRPAVTTTVVDADMLLRNEHGWEGEERDLAIARLAAQEWFGKRLTPRTWGDAWLSEGFVHFMAQVYAEAEVGPARATDIRTWANVGTFAADRDHRRPLVYNRWLYGPIELWLTEHLQHRGAVVLHLLRAQLGDSLFWRGMQHYVAKFTDSTVTTEDFRTAMQEATGRDLSQFFRQWIYGSGFPILRVAYAYNPTSHAVILRATQVQHRDFATGFFLAPVDVDIYTDRGRERHTFPLQAREVSEDTIPLPSELRAVEWDPRHLLDFDVEFPRPTALLVYQLEHGDTEARREALKELHMHASGMGRNQGAMVAITDTESGQTPSLPSADTVARDAVLRAARSDSSLAVRIAAVEGISMMWDTKSSAVLLELSHDTSAVIRGIVTMGLLSAFQPAAEQRLRAMADSDPDADVRSAATETLGMRDRGIGRRAAVSLAGKPLDTESEQLAALHATSGEDPQGWVLAKRILTTPNASRRVRAAASRTLSIGVFMSHFNGFGNAAELVELLTPLLNSDDPSDRLVAARDIAAAKIPAARAALLARKQVEADARILTQIDESLREIERPDPPFPHQ